MSSWKTLWPIQVQINRTWNIMYLVKIRNSLARSDVILYWLCSLLVLSPALVYADGYPCLVEPHMEVNLSTAVEGVLASVTVSKGDKVEKGAVVAMLESDIERLFVEQAQARAEATSIIDAREVSLAASSKRYERVAKLSKQKFVSPDELDELKSAVDISRLELKTEKENNRLARIELKRARAELAQRTIRSPLNGVVVERYLNPGEFAQAQPIVRIAELNPLNVEAVLPGDDYGKVQVGMLASVHLLGAYRRTIEADVTIVEKVIDAASGTFGVRVEITNEDYKIPAGLECTLTFPVSVE
ncbi:MAG: efflux RND transporter periplasmic adaptor subunit [Sedimenticola sp.]